MQHAAVIPTCRNGYNHCIVLHATIAHETAALDLLEIKKLM